jgi:hypothetical protein
MKSLTLFSVLASTAIVLLTGSAHAEVKPVGTLVPFLECRDPNGGIDNEFSVRLMEKVGYKYSVAEISESTFVGFKILGTYRINMVSSTKPSLPFGPAMNLYRGRGIQLKIVYSHGPADELITTAHLFAKLASGERVNRKLTCEPIMTTMGGILE